MVIKVLNVEYGASNRFLEDIENALREAGVFSEELVYAPFEGRYEENVFATGTSGSTGTSFEAELVSDLGALVQMGETILDDLDEMGAPRLAVYDPSLLERVRPSEYRLKDKKALVAVIRIKDNPAERT